MGNLCISEDADYTIQPKNNINVLVVGSSGVGKSTIVNKLVYNKGSKPQETTSHQYHYIFHHNFKIKFIDTSGIPYFQRCIPLSLISKCQVVIYVCDGDVSSIEGIVSWRKRILHCHKRILVINKKQTITDDFIKKIIDLGISFSNILYFDVDEPNYILEEILLRQTPIESTKIQLSAFEKYEEETYEPLTIQYID